MPYRIRDLILAMIMAIFLCPLLAAISVVIYLFHGRPVLYAEKRAGIHGKLFTIYKFRTLTAMKDQPEAANDLEERVSKNGTPENCRHDFFIFLRRYSLDELPQVWNVIRGDMSIVGPRPMPTRELLYRFGTDAPKITSVPPGMTGLWQVSGRNDLSPEERRRLDLCYVEKRSRLLDLKIILKTFYAVVSGRGAY